MSRHCELTNGERPWFLFKGFAATIKDPSEFAMELLEWQNEGPYNPA